MPAEAHLCLSMTEVTALCMQITLDDRPTRMQEHYTSPHLVVASRPKGAVEGLGANHELAAEPSDVVLLVHDGQAREVVPLVGLAARARHVHGDQDCGQRGAVQPHKGPLIRPPVCTRSIHVGSGTVSAYTLCAESQLLPCLNSMQPTGMLAAWSPCTESVILWAYRCLKSLSGHKVAYCAV